jgi:DNA-binding NarL/FixJ family response regulator
MITRKKIFIVEDHQLFRESLKAMLARNQACEVVGESADGLEALRQLQKIKPDQVLEGYIQHDRRLKPKSTWDSITAREKEVLKLIAEGFSNKQIAKVLRISIKTVEKHRSSLMAKLDMHNAAALAAYAVQKGLITTDDTHEG